VARVGDPRAVLALAERLGWPVLADPRSGCRLPHPNVVAAADANLASETAATALSQRVVLLGERWASKVLAGFLSSARRGVPSARRRSVVAVVGSDRQATA